MSVVLSPGLSSFLAFFFGAGFFGELFLELLGLAMLQDEEEQEYSQNRLLIYLSYLKLGSQKNEGVKTS